MTTGPTADFRPTFATNRVTPAETVADAINTLLAGMRLHLAHAPDIAIATAYFNPGGFSLLADQLEQVGRVRLLLGVEPEPTEPRIRALSTAAGRRAARARVQQALEGHERSMEEGRNLLGFTQADDATAGHVAQIGYRRGEAL